MKSFLLSFVHAFRGVFDSFKLGRNARMQWIATGIVVCTGFILDISGTEWIAVILCIALVHALEAINTAIELLADEITLEKRDSIRKIKDLSAGAVLLASIGSTIVAAVIVFSHVSNY